MNKKSLAKKIFNFKKNKKNISEEWKDEGLGHLQSALSTVSAVSSILPGIGTKAGIVTGAASWVVNRTRQELDASGVVPSKSGNLATQGSMIAGALSSMALGTKTGVEAVRNIPFGVGPAIATVVTKFPRVGKIGAAGAMLASTEWAGNIADPVSKTLGIPNIPGISKRLTRKEPISTTRQLDVARSSSRLDLIAAANKARAE